VNTINPLDLNLKLMTGWGQEIFFTFSSLYRGFRIYSKLFELSWILEPLH